MADSRQTPSVVPLPEGSRPKLLDQVRHTIRMRHYSQRTEATYVHWIRRFIVFHHKQHPSTLGAPEITAFLSWLATGQRVSASTQNQALSALLFLYRHVLRIEVGAIDQVPRAKLPHRVPVVLSREEVGTIFKHIQGTMWMVAHPLAFICTSRRCSGRSRTPCVERASRSASELLQALICDAPARGWS
jgi:hypothetical protein